MVHFIRTVQGTKYPKFSYLAVYEISALANHQFLVSVENDKNYHVFYSESFVVCKVIKLKIGTIHQDITGYNIFNYLVKVVYELSAIEKGCFV